MNLRQRIVAEAKTWIGTPFHDQAGVKGVGVDCAYLVGKTAEATGCIEKFQVAPYTWEQFWHSDKEMLCDIVEGFGCTRVNGFPSPGDIVVFQMPRTRACCHLGIMIENNQFIHAHLLSGVRRVVVNTLEGEYFNSLKRIYSFPGVEQ
jgi:cell wall-associated NlpC family hydrolase